MKLCTKLDNIGIRGDILNWIRAFLSDRQQRVLLDSQCSEWTTVTSGVPQWSILGLFLVYVNDISTNMSSETRLFADDCTLFRNVSCKQDCISLQNDLTKIFSWSQTWQLSLNISISKLLCISNKRSPPSYTYMMNNSPLEFVGDFKYLGVHCTYRQPSKVEGPPLICLTQSHPCTQPSTPINVQVQEISQWKSLHSPG